ncbi:hypothetical protein ACIQM0_27275, partial [Streptomyces sp. NPDC091387]
MAVRKPQRRREFGTVRQLPSGRWQTRYWAPDGSRRTAPETFDTRTEAQTWLTLTQADIERKHWVDPDAGSINFETYAQCRCLRGASSSSPGHGDCRGAGSLTGHASVDR